MHRENSGTHSVVCNKSSIIPSPIFSTLCRCYESAMQPYIRHRVSEMRPWKKPGSQPGAGPTVSALPTVSQALTLSELANRGCACAWSKDKRAQPCSLAQGALVRQTLEVPPPPALLLRVCKPEGGCSPVYESLSSSKAAKQPLLLQGTPEAQPGVHPQCPSEVAARCGRVGSQGTLSQWHLQQRHTAQGLEVQLSHWLSQSPCLETTVTTSCTNKGLSARMRSLRAKLQSVLAWYAASKLLGILFLLLLSLHSALSNQSLLPTGKQALCATGEKETWISRAQ